MQHASNGSLPRREAQTNRIDPREQLRAKLLAMIVKNESQRKSPSS